jgi:hypothetical protein
MSSLMLDNPNNRKFIVIEPPIIDAGICVVLSNVGFWTMYYNELETWCNQNNSHLQGMTVQLPDENTLTLFCLQWS